MDERKIELEIAAKCIQNLNDFMRNSVDCDCVMAEEYKQIGDILNRILERRIALEIDVEGVGYERV